MKPLAACLLVGLLLAGCAGEQSSLLDQELLNYRYEQEKFRREDLEALYREEAELSDRISERILALREEIAAKEEELERLQAKLSELEDAIRQAREQAAATASPAKPPPAKDAPAKPKPEPDKPVSKPPAK